jgi:FAD/FMN-containing dehydrogenase
MPTTLRSAPNRPAAITPAAWHRQSVNDVHSRINATRVAGVVRPASLGEVRGVLRDVRAAGLAVSIAGGRHAMGGQQFGTDDVLIDTRGLNRVLSFDPQAGTVEAQAGVQWPELIDHLAARPDNRAARWTIRQKQTGADRLSIGGALAANIHGRGLRMRPFIGDVESFTLLGADGRLRTCSRAENAELFALAVGGYGLFGFVYSVTLRLARRHKLRRTVVETTAGDLAGDFDRCIADGFTFGDFQFAVGPGSGDFLRRGIFSCYRPVDDGDDDDAPVVAGRRTLSDVDWRRLLHLAHVDKSRAYALYAGHYLATSGQVYFSDEHQLTPYVDCYHDDIDRLTGSRHPGGEMITELYVPRPRLAEFMAACGADLPARGADVIYGTVRLIERDDESFLAWAREPFACVIFNLHVEHTPAGIARAGGAFRGLIDRAAALGGSYYLTYHRFATREQVLACHPRFPEFLRRKLAHDPGELFQSNWYRHHRALLR